MPTTTLASLEALRSELANSKYYLNIRSGYMAPITLHCSYGDSGETVTFYVFDGGQKIDLSNASVSLHGTRKDGASFGPFACTTSDNAISFTLQSSMTAVEGSGIAEFTIAKNGATIGTCNFGIMVENATFPNGVAYDSDPSIYQDILKYIQTISARIDNYIASGTAATDSELIDVRVKADGTIAASAGTAVREQISDLEDTTNQYRGDLAGADPTVSNVKVGVYQSRKTSGSAGYPADMETGRYCFITYFYVDSGSRYFILTEVSNQSTNGTVWIWVSSRYVRLSSDSYNDQNLYKYRGDLAGADPITSEVKIGTYLSRKTSSSTGYPAELEASRYCHITYFYVDNNNRYFILEEASNKHTNGQMWLYNGKYVQIVTENSDSFYPDGEVVSFTERKYYILDSGTYLPTALSTSDSSLEQYVITSNIPVTPGEKYILNVGMKYENCMICIYNSSDSPIYHENMGERSDGSWQYFENHVVTVPNNASYMIVGFDNKVSYSVKKFERYRVRPYNFTGLKWTAIGDSLTDAMTVRANEKYYDYIKQATGISFVNLGSSGTGYVADDNGRSNTFIDRVSSIPDDTNIVTIFGSGNDMNKLTLGTASDTTNTTLMGNVYLTVQSIFTNKPNVLLGIIAPTPWQQYPPYTDDNKMLLFAEELGKFCKRYSIPFLNLYECSNMRPWEATFRSSYYSQDGGGGTHPDARGNKRFAPMILDFISKIVS